MKKIKSKNNILAPLMVTAMLIAPMTLISDSYAQQRPRPGTERDENRGENRNENRPGRRGNWERGDYRFDHRDDDQSWRRSFIGQPSFKLIDDIELQQHNQSLRMRQQALDNLEEQREAKAKELKIASDKVDSLEKEIDELSKAISSSTIKKTELQSQIGQLEKEIPSLETQLSLAQAAATNTQQGVDQTTAKLNQAKEQLAAAETACTSAPSAECQAQVTKQKEQVNQLTQVLTSKEALNKAAQEDLNSKRKALNLKKKAIADKQAEMQSIDTENMQRATKITTLRPQLQIALAEEKKIDNEMTPIEQRIQRTTIEFRQAVAMREKYRENLIREVLQFNSQGARTGSEHGAADGSELAYQVGTQQGQQDGDREGFVAGTREGQERDFRRGSDQGEREGSSRGQSEGSSLGSSEGRRAGNSDAGIREGSAQGRARAEASDAAKVGQQQGATAGLDRALREGDRTGTPKGEAEAINKFEKSSLQTQSSSGDFAGAFDRRTPDYNGRRGGRYRPDNATRREILRKAFNDGYDFRYAEVHRYEYLRQIDGIYNRVYQDSFDAARATAYGQNYQEYFNRGRVETDSRAYNREFPVARQQAFEANREAFSSNPERDASEYRGSFTQADNSTYGSVYEEIRSANFARTEQETFNSNINDQIEIHRNKRFEEVSKIYLENDVLDYNGSEIIDGGINKIAAKDGIFQPGETVFHNVTITNYGHKAATNVKVTSNDGTVSTIAEIPARTTVTIKGAGKGSIPQNSRIGGNALTSVKVQSSIKAEAKIQARHFDNAGKSELKSADQKQVSVNYPMALSGLTTQSQLLLGQANGLRMSVTNQSNRNYRGPFKVELSSNSSSNIITKSFDDVAEVNGTINLSDAKLLVSDERDVYTPITFKAHIHFQGVKLGELSREFTTMVKAPFIDKANTPVVITDSDSLATDLLDTISELGGISKVSVLDLSLSDLNSAAIAKGLQNRVAIVVDNGRGTVATKLQKLLETSVNTAFVMVDEQMNSANVLRNLPAFKDAIRIPSDLKGFGKKFDITFTNQLRASGLKSSNMVIQANRVNYRQVLSLATKLSQSTDQLLASAKAEINKSTFGTENLTLQLLTIKALAEVANINKAYAESGGWFSRDGKFADMIDNDKSLVINKMKAASDVDANNANIGIILSAIALKDGVEKGVSNFDPVAKDMTIKVRGRVTKQLDKMYDQFKKSLKKFDRDLYNRADGIAAVHRPFDVQESSDWSNNDR